MLNVAVTLTDAIRTYAGYVTSVAAYRKERRYVLEQLAWHRRNGRTSSYYRSALLGLRFGLTVLR